LKKIIFIWIILLCFTRVQSQEIQEMKEGRISFISSEHVYVKFDNTKGIEKGDTLYFNQNNRYLPALVVKDLSSLSCICIPILKNQLVTGNIITGKIRKKEIPLEVISEKKPEALTINEVVLKENQQLKKEKQKNDINGRISISSYTYLSAKFNNVQRLKYNVSFRAEDIADTKLSTDVFMTFSQRMGDRFSYSHDLKIYSLAVDYKIDSLSKITIGRKLNPGMANIGAVDGIQYEGQKKNFSYGALIGSRPDQGTYGFNPMLMQAGIFASHRLDKFNMHTTLAFFNQMNDWKTDRRYLYLQHSNQIVKNLNFFGSAEIDLYAVENGLSVTKPDLTGTYLSVRYKPLKNLSASVSYDARKNVYYYETYKNFADSIFDKETRQGFRLQVLYLPFKNLTWNTFGGYRLPAGRDEASINTHSSLTYSELPFIPGSSFTINGSYLSTAALRGTIYGAELEKDFLSGKMNVSLQYEHVNYNFYKINSVFIQNIAELALYWRINRQWMISSHGEFIVEPNLNYIYRVFLNLNYRF
jgi:hypothetical protein